jgi:glycosyltransferase involved in cell wall biosynthesis
VDDRKSILVLDTGREWGGGTNSLIELLKRLDKERYRITALFYHNYMGQDRDIKSELSGFGIPCLSMERTKMSRGVKILKEIGRTLLFFHAALRRRAIFFIDYHSRIVRDATRIAEVIRGMPVDLLYLNNQPSSNLEGLLAAEMTGVPAVQHSRIAARLNGFEVLTANRIISKMICVSEGVRNTFVGQGIDASKCVVVLNGIDSVVRPALDREELRRDLGVPDGALLFGTVCSLVKRKRIGDILEAFSSVLRQTRLPVRLLIVGQGPQKDSLTGQARRQKIADHVIFTGFQRHAISFINAIDIFVLASEKEGLPRVILEAMLMKKPVIATRAEGCSELVADGQTGFLVPVGSPESLTRAMLDLLENETLRTQMGELARSRVIAHFSVEAYAREVESILKAAMAP